ncbi:unnamed protein product [Kuraishia capsulata CBS 1993]|uniref:Endonuclease n=1 Tax=Kuraishia capsulata CBS 1993 TaxID=1382522 RepID=W6MX19_9ASCO|nr:uncharacterized protein KUCA_T00004106001 [Kuraishia capsulata CBS 1993]CDK28125.1 unnamed protein product [Kuraishia capsulata CBS 1993]
MFKHTVPVSVMGLGIASYFWGRSSPSGSANASPGGIVFPPPDKERGNTGISSKKTPTQITGPETVQPADFFKYGFPGPVHDLEKRSEFVSCYDRQKRNPYYVIEHITPESLQKNESNGNRKHSVFREDEQVPEKFRARLRDYFRSGYDRGHQAPAADAKFSQEAMDETFYLTNMSPQVGDGFNRDYWAFFEDFCRRLTSRYRSVRIVTGPLYLPKQDPLDGKFKVTYEVIGNPPSIAVPTHFFKLIVAETPLKGPQSGSNGVAVAAFVLPNDVISNTTPLRSFEVPVEALERSSGLEFLQRVPASEKRQLCLETDCSIIVKEYNNAVKSLPAPKN